MVGGVPAGTRRRPGEDGCRKKSIAISNITMHGNKRTNPSGIDIFELPFIRMRRLKRENRGSEGSLFSLFHSFFHSFTEGKLAEEGMPFLSRCRKLIIADSVPVRLHAQWPHCWTTRIFPHSLMKSSALMPRVFA